MNDALTCVVVSIATGLFLSRELLDFGMLKFGGELITATFSTTYVLLFIYAYWQQ